MEPLKDGYKVVESFRGIVLSRHTSKEEAYRTAAICSKDEPVDVWTMTGGLFGLGRVIAHFNKGKQTG